MLKDTLRNMNLYVNGRGYAGAIDELTLPKLTIKTEEYRGGGMDMPIEIDMGMEKMELSFMLSKFDKDVLNTFGLRANAVTMLTVRGSILSEETGEEVPVVINVNGIVREMDFGTWKAGENATVKVMLAARYYRLTLNGENLHEIDSKMLVRRINGVDQMELTRKNIGLPGPNVG